MAQKDGQLFRVQAKSFYDKKYLGKYRNENSVYRVAEIRTSNMTDGKYHQSYNGLVDMIILVDVDTGEVFSIPPDHGVCQVSKNTLGAYKIFPIPD